MKKLPPAGRAGDVQGEIAYRRRKISITGGFS